MSVHTLSRHTNSLPPIRWERSDRPPGTAASESATPTAPVTTIASRLSEPARSEEHTSELQSLAYLVCRLLLEKKKKKKQNTNCATNGQSDVYSTNAPLLAL